MRGMDEMYPSGDLELLKTAAEDYERALLKLKELEEFNGVLIEENDNLGQELMGMKGFSAMGN